VGVPKGSAHTVSAERETRKTALREAAILAGRLSLEGATTLAILHALRKLADDA